MTRYEVHDFDETEISGGAVEWDDGSFTIRWNDGSLWHTSSLAKFLDDYGSEYAVNQLDNIGEEDDD